MLREESTSFPVEDSDIGDVNSNFMKISLNDQVLGPQSDNSIPRLLYKELKYYIEDLLNRQWVVNSKHIHLPLLLSGRKWDVEAMQQLYKMNNKTIPGFGDENPRKRRNQIPQLQTRVPCAKMGNMRSSRLSSLFQPLQHLLRL